MTLTPWDAAVRTAILLANGETQEIRRNRAKACRWCGPAWSARGGEAMA